MEKVRREKMQVREKVGKSRFTVFFQWFGAPEGWQVTSLKRRVRSQLARWEMKNCTPLWREAHFQVKMDNAHQPGTTFWRPDVEKVHAIVGRSTFPSQKCQKPTVSEHFWKLSCRKSAPRCGAKHISKSKCAMHTNLGPLLEVQLSKKCTPFVPYKTHQPWTTFWRPDIEKSARCCGAKHISKSKVSKTEGSGHFVTFRCRPPPPPPPQQQQQQQLLLLPLLLLLLQLLLLQLLLQQLQLQV